MGKLIDALKHFEKSLASVIEGNIDAYIGLCMVYDRANRPELVEQTMVTMANLFRNHPRCHAYFSLQNSSRATPLPGQFTRDQIEIEAKNVREAFGL
jgi:kynurenine formamidase